MIKYSGDKRIEEVIDSYEACAECDEMVYRCPCGCRHIIAGCEHVVE